MAWSIFNTGGLLTKNTVTKCKCKSQDRSYFWIFTPHIQLHRGPRSFFRLQVNINWIATYLNLSPPRKVKGSCHKKNKKKVSFLLDYLLQVHRTMPFEKKKYLPCSICTLKRIKWEKLSELNSMKLFYCNNIGQANKPALTKLPLY